MHSITIKTYKWWTFYRVSRILGKRERNGTETESGNGNDQRKMPDEGYHLNIRVRFYSMMLLCNIVGPSVLFR